MREIVHLQAGQCGNQIGAKVRLDDQIDVAKFNSSKTGEFLRERESCSCTTPNSAFKGPAAKLCGCTLHTTPKESHTILTATIAQFHRLLH